MADPLPYPPGPRKPPLPVEPTRAYRARVLLVLFALCTFLILYLAMVAGAGYMVWHVGALLFTAEEGGFVQVMLLLGALMLFAFLVKGLFRRSGDPAAGSVLLEKEEQPMLFDFVRRVCEESGTPFPGSIHLTYDLNASVFYPQSLINLVRPARKRLQIGLALVNAVDLSEFKAVLAHEFGHFAQSSMKLGQYVYESHKVIHAMVYGRDAWDELLVTWRRVDLRLSFPAWGLTLVVWVLRTVLAGVYRLIRLADFSLSRQMEFNADLHAVRLAGSDAIVSSLWRIERNTFALRQAWEHLRRLADDHTYAQDLFALQTREQERLGDALARVEDPSPFVRGLARSYTDGPEAHFEADDESASSVWETHPPNRDREANAKNPYVPAPRDHRPAGILLRDTERLREELTRRAYRAVLGVRVGAKAEVLPPEGVRALIEEELEESRQADHYHGFYEGRWLRLGELDALIASVKGGEAGDAATLRSAAARWSGDSLAAHLARGPALEEALAQCQDVVRGRKRPKEHMITIDGRKIPVRTAAQRAAELEEEKRLRQADAEGADRAIFLHFYAIAGEARAELVRRYRLLVRLQDSAAHLRSRESGLSEALMFLKEGGELDAMTFERVRDALLHAAEALQQVRKHCSSVPLPPLAQVPEGLDLGQYLDRGTRRLGPLAKRQIDGRWISQLVLQWGFYSERLGRLHKKNLGALLRLQERLDPDLYRPLLPGPLHP